MGSFELNPDFADEFLRGNQELDNTMRLLGEKVLARAKANALPHVKTGHYLASLEGDLNRNSKDHPYYRVASSARYADSVEFGDDDQPGQRILGRAIGENLEAN